MQLFKIVHTSIQTQKIDEHKLWQSRAGRHCPIPGRCGAPPQLLSPRLCQLRFDLSFPDAGLTQNVSLSKKMLTLFYRYYWDRLTLVSPLLYGLYG